MSRQPVPGRRPRLPREVDEAIRAVAGEPEPERAAITLALIVHRATNELHKLSRTEASRRRGEPEWGGWASLQNASRDVLLRAATCRRVASQLASAASDSDQH